MFGFEGTNFQKLEFKCSVDFKNRLALCKYNNYYKFQINKLFGDSFMYICICKVVQIHICLFYKFSELMQLAVYIHLVFISEFTDLL